LIAQAVHDEFVVDDFVTHIDRCAPFFDRHFDDFDGAINTSAKSAWGGEI
jgi:hypothetical protein